MRISKKILAGVLAALMAIAMMPFTAFAATVSVTTGAELKAAVASAANGDVIEFAADNTTYPATSSGALVIPVDGKDITIDLKGHTQYFRVDGETAVSYPTDLFVLKNGAKLTVKDSVGGGAIYATYGGSSSAYIFNVLDSSELVIDGGTYVVDQANYGGVVVYQNSADASTTINGGTFTANTGAKARRDYLINNTRGEVEINGGTFSTPRAFDYVISEGNTTDTSLTINDGEFNGTMSLDVTKAETTLNGGTYLTNDGVANTAVSAYLPADQIINSTTGEIKDIDASTVARTNSAEFTTLKAALDSVGEGKTETITLIDDCTLASTYDITNNQKITINMNGNDIDCAARVFNIRHGQLTLSGTGALNATFTGANAAVAVYGAATDSGSNYSVFTLNSTVTINATNGYGAMIGATSGAAYGAKLQINGTINSKYGLFINGNVAEPDVKTNAAAINVTGTVTSSNADAVVYAAGYAKWNIYSNANLTGGSGVYIKSGTMNIYGNAVITATGAKTEYKFNPSGCDATGDAIIIDSCGYPGNVPTVSIKAGTITSANGAAVASYCKQDDPSYPTADFPRVDNVIPGTSTATFSSDVTDLAEDGYTTQYDKDAGGYVVGVAPDDQYNIAVDTNIDFNFYLDNTKNNIDKVRLTYNATPDKEQNTQKTFVRDYSSSITINLAPAQIHDAIKIEALDDEGNVIRSYDTSIAEYCNVIISENNNAKLVQLAKATLDYGKAASDYFDYNEAAFTDEYKLGDFDASEYSYAQYAFYNGPGNITAVRYVAKSVPELRFEFSDLSIYEANRLNHWINVNDDESSVTAEFAQLEDGTIVLRVMGISIDTFLNDIDIFGGMPNHEFSLHYSPITWVIGATKSGNEKLAKLGNAVGNYFDAVQNYNA